MKVVRTRIHEFRKEKGLTQDDLAKLVGVRRETVGHLENVTNNPSLKLAMEVAEALDASLDELYYFKEVKG